MPDPAREQQIAWDHFVDKKAYVWLAFAFWVPFVVTE